MGKNTKIFLIVLAIFTLISVLIYEHFFDYDISQILRNPNPIFSPQTNLTGSLTKIKHVFVIVEENRNWSEIYKNPEAPYINNTLLPMAAFAQNYHNTPVGTASLHPSEPNYILLEAGKIAFSDHIFTTDGDPDLENSTGSDEHLAYLMDKAGYTWKSYQESISGKSCPIISAGEYAAKHNPFIFFQDVSGNPPDSGNTFCISHIRPLTEIQGDLANGTVADYNFITPNLINDMHDGTITEADTWLSQEIPIIMNSQAYKDNGAIFITWDEGTGSSDTNPAIGMIIISPLIKQNYSNSVAYSHVSLVKTIQEIFHLDPLLGLAADPATQDLSDFFK